MIEFFPTNYKAIDKGNLLGQFDLEIRTDDGVMVKLSGMKLFQRASDGKKFIKGPSVQFKGQAGDDREKVFVRVWPDKANWGKTDAIVDRVVELMEEGEPAEAAAPAAAPKPAQSANVPDEAPW